jgi:superfamily II DNA or RNA helicase
MTLRDLTINDSYRSGKDRFANDFFIPCLSESISYSRAVGYFTSGSLALVAPGLDKLVARGGRIRLVASPYLTEEDVEQIKLGYELRDVVERALLREIDGADEAQVPRLGRLGRLIADGFLDIRIAVARFNGGIGLYHEKIGIFADAFGNAVSFIGSMNETVRAHIENLESFEVFRSWQPDDARRVAQHAHDFELLWSGENPAVEISELPDMAVERFQALVLQATDFDDQISNPDLPILEPKTNGFGEPRIPGGLDLREYQRAAVTSWFQNDGRGTLKMATGTGKTVTALAATAQLYRFLQQKKQSLLTIVVCPYQHLVDQWAGELKAFGVEPFCCYESYTAWAPQVERLLSPLNSGSLRHLALVTTVATFRGQPFQTLLRKVEASVILIADEVHNMGASGVRAKLPEKVRYRLALSATPERWYDEEGTDALFTYFGATVYELTLGTAIELGALSRYRYTPVVVALDSDETDHYFELTARIAQMSHGEIEPGDDGPDEILGRLLRRRAGLVGHAVNKLPALQHQMAQRSSEWFQLVYCAEGTPPLREEDPSQVASVLDLLGNQMRATADKYVSDTPRNERRSLLSRFGTGDDLRYLVSMRCLDEGVDIPDARVAYLLASSSNPRQFIQRRGRILRLPKDGRTKVAEIIDFVAVPEASATGAGVDGTDQALVRRELTRVLDFASLAINGPEAIQALLAVRQRYHLLDV